jgi:hypothetical protein
VSKCIQGRDQPDPLLTFSEVEGTRSQPRARARIAIRGHSGSQVRVVETSTGAVVVKSAVDGSQVGRLELQIAKQRQARLDNELSFVRVPEILAEVGQGSGYEATMEYVYFQNPIEYMNRVSITGVARLADMLLGFVDFEVRRSPRRDVPVDPFHAKLDEIARTLSDGPRYYDYLDHLKRLHLRLADRATLDLPVGHCHGDLTMSNILVAPDSAAIALVDFLDSFIDSPLVDLAKLRQDTRFHWTLLMADQPVDRVRFQQIMLYVDRSIEETYRGCDWYTENIDMMMAMNLLRIAPYATSAAVHDFLVTSLAHVRI